MQILLVEDNDEMRLATRGLLEGFGHTVHAVGDGEEALKVLANPSILVDELVTDVELPGISGTDLLRRLIAAGSRLPLIAASSLSRSRALEELEPLGRIVFLRKPFSAEQLRQALIVAPERVGNPLPPLEPPLGETSPGDMPKSSALGPSPAPSPVRGTTFLGLPLPSGALRGGAIAAGILLAVLLGGGWFLQVCCTAPQLPPAPIDSAQRGGRILLDEPLGELSQPPLRFRWASADSASRYRVLLTAVDDRVLWEEIVEGPPALLSVALRKQLERAVVYHWQVEALDDEGRIVGRSEKARFLLRLEPRTSAPALGDAS